MTRETGLAGKGQRKVKNRGLHHAEPPERAINLDHGEGLLLNTQLADCS